MPQIDYKPTEFLTVPEVADKLRVEARTVYRLIERGELHATRVGRLIRIPIMAYENFITSQTGIPAKP